jgi:TonB family protein
MHSLVVGLSTVKMSLVLLPLAAAMVSCGPATNQANGQTGTKGKDDQTECPETKDGQLPGILSKQKIAEVVRERIGMMKMCSKTYGKPGESGRVTVKFIIEPDGTVEVADIADSTLENERVERCMVFAAKALRFPQPYCGGIVIVVYPFEISVPAAEKQR